MRALRRKWSLAGIAGVCAASILATPPAAGQDTPAAFGIDDSLLKGRFSFELGFGREVDAGIAYAWNENLTLRLQHARYDPGAGTPDPSIRKTWLTLTYSY